MIAAVTIDNPDINHSFAEPVHTVAQATIDTTHVNRTLTAPVHTVAAVTIDVAPYQSHARRTRSHGRRSHD
ncbi:MAG TPA: hypothetical protein VE974_19115 [Thermoanaerobaculia bacterium]|nr:hypothetical protein [Thermoanaerobaculia bacterium]